MITKLDLLMQARRIASSYSQATGVDCIVLENHSPSPLDKNPLLETCRLCPSAKGAKAPLACHRDRENYFFPKSSGSTYIHLCRSGFVFWGSSVLWRGQPVVSILACSSLLKEESESLQAYKQGLGRSVEYNSTATEILDCAPKRIQSMAEILFLCCQVLSLGNEIPSVSPNLIFPWSLRSHTSSNFTSAHNDSSTVHSLDEDGYRDLDNYEKRDLHDLIQDAFSNKEESLETVKARALELSNWLAKIASVSGLLDEDALSANLTRLKEIENQNSIENLYKWLGEITNSFYKTAFKLHDVQHGDCLAKAIRYMHQKYYEDISMEDVSTVADLSYSYFSRIFKKEVGVNFNDYLNQIRIEKSKKILLSSDISLLEIAQKCGFKDQSYYSKAFKKVVGISPGKFRTQAKQRLKT